MGLAPEVQLVVKHTFLEFVEKGCTQEPRFRAFTDTALLDEYASTASSSHSEVGDAEEPAAMLPMSTLSTPCLEPAAEPFSLPLWADQAYAHPCMAEAFPWMAQVAPEGALQTCMAWMPMSLGHQAYPGLPLSPEGTQPHVATEAPTTPATDPDHTASTTLMLRGLPQACTRDCLLELLDDLGFAGHYDLVYAPVDFSTQAGLRYAFVNAVSPASARRLWACFDGFQAWPMPSEQACTVCWSDPHQGVAAHVERYRNSPVMHESVPDSWKPALFEHGLRVPFPAPTRAVKAPKAPRSRRSEGA